MKKLEYLLGKFFELTEKIGKHNVMLIAFVTIVLIITGLYSTFSIFTATDGIDVVEGLTTYKFVLNKDLSTNSIIVPANTVKNLDVVVTNNESIDLKYGLYYNANGELTIGYTSTDFNNSIMSNDVSVISLKVNNDTINDITLTLGVAYGFETGGKLTIPEGSISIASYPYLSEDGTNLPNLDDFNLIPVYYDEIEEVWKKADWTNASSSWYNYDEKRWANAVIISDDIKRKTYQVAEVGTVIEETDITAFMVWIPRFKYNVWNITRQIGTESTYSYPAYTNGINIEWEKGIKSTGNVECNYDIVSKDKVLADTCVYNREDEITPTSGNENYADAWYTHPAFTFGKEEKSGFWIGKFETTGTPTEPTILPDMISLTNQNISNQFTTSKLFQKYVSEDIDAHMLTNLEWGAVTYLMHSKYGLCDQFSCRDTYINNSQNLYTGRSAGILAKDSFYDDYGTYNYKGYVIDSVTGDLLEEKDSTKIASTTGNITGIYDLSGGALEYVMGNMVNDKNEFYSQTAGDKWSESSSLSNQYYNAYKYGTTSQNQEAYNRARLGDATAEIMLEDVEVGTWHYTDELSITAFNFVNVEAPWFTRGGDYKNIDGTSSFYFSNNSGESSITGSFRIALS